ncbi:hypothetical protein ACUX4R_28480, partial [Salmonella enterica]
QNEGCNQRGKNTGSEQAIEVKGMECRAKSRLRIHTRMQPTPFVTTPLKKTVHFFYVEEVARVTMQ